MDLIKSGSNIDIFYAKTCATTKISIVAGYHVVLATLLFLNTCLRSSPSGLVVSAQKCFRSVDKYGHRQPSLIFTDIASPPKFVGTLHMNSSQCLDVSARKRFWSVNKYGRTAAIFNFVNCPLLNTLTVTISLSHLLWDCWLDFLKLVWDVPLVV